MCCDLWGPGKREARQREHKEMMKKHTGVERRQMLMECSSKIRGQSVQELLCTSWEVQQQCEMIALDPALMITFVQD